MDKVCLGVGEGVRIWIRSVRQSVNEGVGGVWNIYRQGV